MRRLPIVCGLLAVAALSLTAQAPRPSQDAASRPAPRTRKVDLNTTYVQVAVRPGDEVYARVDGARVKQYVNEITEFARQARDAGVKYWGRIAGSPHDALVHAWSEKKFRELGLENVRTQEFALNPQWWPTSWQLTATGSGTTLKPTSVFPARGTAATPAGGLNADAVWVGLGTEADFAGRDVKGKIAVMHSWPTDAPHGHSAGFLGSLQRAAQKGAAAVVVNRATPGNFQLIGHNAPVTTLWIGSDDANALRDLIAKGPVKIQMELSVERRSGLKDANVWGTLPGATDEEIFVKAHHDGYFEGAMDNATGVATVVALAEYFSKIPRAQRRRSITFVSVAAHHGGGDRQWMSDPLHPITDKAALMINCEHTALSTTMTFGDRLRRSTGVDPERWTVNGSDKLAQVLIESFNRMGVTLYEEMEGSGGDDGEPRNLPGAAGLMPSINFIHSPQWLYHTDNDKPEFIPAHGLAASVRAFARIIDEVNKLSIPELRSAARPAATSAAR